ncbi:glycosyl hydrolase family 8 [Skermanella pratensis]|uniref:glycosyl hydrolase family 8 n=1 Tax=Skermanella pratensis TaxID=2233999 RepID=UPI0013015E3F|nr:glycosyl hydrolase family 8 [Skermanella pratensis]
MRAILLILALLGATVGGAGAASAGAPLHRSEWQAFVTRFVLPEGRVSDTGNKGISHSEGQGYGMVMATAYGDRETFDRLWRWTAANLQVRGDHLFAWKWEPGPAAATDLNSASDGDILIAWGLLRAAGTWNDEGYAAAALAILDDVRDRLVVETSLGRVLLPGPEGFVRDGSVVLNPSYWVFPALEAFARRHDGDLWRAVSDSGRALIRRARFGEAGLPPDWVELAGTGMRLPSGFETVFGFNAIRVPLYAIWGGLDDADALNRPVISWWSGHDGAPYIPATVDLATNARAPYGLSAGGRAVSVLTRFRGDALPLLPSLGDADDYYSATLILLTKIAFSERFMR